MARFLGERRDFDVYKRERFLRRCIEREVEIIGEATKRILQADPTFELENARKIIATRNRRQAERRACLHELARGAKEETAA